jgi:hypothetical protein
MTPNTQTSSGLSNSKPAPVDRVKQFAAILLSERGEASGAQVARELHHVCALRQRSTGVAARYAVCAASSRPSCVSAIFARSGTNQAYQPSRPPYLD